MPNIWVCKTGNGNGRGVGDDYHALIERGLGGFNLAGKYDPTKFMTLEDLDRQIAKDLGNWQPGHVTGRSFGRQLWDLAKTVRPGDWFYLECPNAAPKDKSPALEKGKRGPQRTFVVAAGIVTGPYAYKPNASCIHQLKVDWQWTGMELISYGFQTATLVLANDKDPQVMADLKAIWTPGKVIAPAGQPAVISPKPTNGSEEAESLDREWEEGEVVLRQHLAIERSQAAAKAAKEVARKRGKGVIHCDACGVAPAEAYGEEIIDAHHVIPLSDTKGMARTPTADDFAMLCPNCHRAVHRVLSKGFNQGRDAIETVRKTVFSRRSSS